MALGKKFPHEKTRFCASKKRLKHSVMRFIAPKQPRAICVSRSEDRVRIMFNSDDSPANYLRFFKDEIPHNNGHVERLRRRAYSVGEIAVILN